MRVTTPSPRRRRAIDALLDFLAACAVVQDDGGDPLLAAARCCYRLDAAAQAAITHQGNRTPRPDAPRPEPAARPHGGTPPDLAAPDR